MPELALYGDIGYEITAADFDQQLNGLRGQPVDLLISSYGGDVRDGLAMYSAIRRHAGATRAIVTGYAASIASVVALGADEVLMESQALMMIHEARTLVMDYVTVGDLEQVASALRANNEQITSIYANKSGQPTESVQEWMAAETWFTPDLALAAGLIDEALPGEAVDNLAAVAAAYKTKLAAWSKPREIPKPQPARPRRDALLRRLENVASN